MESTGNRNDPHSSDAFNADEHLDRLMNGKQVDNDLPFVITNPLPDLILDELDFIYILKLERE